MPTDLRRRRIATLSNQIRDLSERRADKARERRALMLDANRDRLLSYADLVALTGTSTGWVASELARARDEAGLAPLPQAERTRLP